MARFIKIPNVIKTFGNSMYPLLLDGDVLYLKKVSFSGIKTNDIITVRERDHYYTHRVIFKAKNYLVTKGDNAFHTDTRVHPHNIVGMVENVKRGKDIFNPEQLYLMQSSLYFSEIINIKNELELNRIGLVFLKGLPLHLYFEKAHPRRLYADCDILIKRQDFPKVKAVLKGFGYKKAKTDLSEEHQKLKGKESEISYYKRLNGFYVTFDIHFEIVFLMTQLGELNLLYPQTVIDSLTEEFISKKRTIRVSGENFPILSKDHLSVYLCLHLFHHNFKGAYRYDFIDTILKKDNPSPKELIKVIKKYRLDNFVYPCLMLLRKYYLTPLPKTLIASIKPSGVLSSYIEKNLLKTDILNEGDRIGGGIRRFSIIFFLSPYPIYKKLFIFTNPEVLYSIFWVMEKKLLGLFKPYE